MYGTFVKIEKTIQPRVRHILIAPLDWGLGHTTRCIPIIRQLKQTKNVEIIVSGASWQLDFLAEEFPDLNYVEMPGYNIRYARKGSYLKWQLLQQFPKLMQTIRKEHQWLEQFNSKHSIQGIISDNRYGMWHASVPNVILTHQLQIKTGTGMFSDSLMRQMHYRQLRNFQEVWIVDTQKEGLAGTLSHPKTLPPNSKYLGLLSQFYRTPTEALQTKQGSLLILLSGPEPQRSLLSDVLWQQANSLKQPVLFVEGKKETQRPSTEYVTHVDQLQGPALTTALKEASMVICRAGYSSIMDLVYLQKKAILIPTPGQTEQEYLGKTLQEKGVFVSFNQKGFSLEKALGSAENFPFQPLKTRTDFASFEEIVSRWLQAL